MKICPICDATYDEEIIRFCTKDGTPLIDQEEPSFVEMPSEELDIDSGAGDDDDIGEITVIRRKDVPAPPPSIDDLNAEVPRPSQPSERIVIPTTPVQSAQDVRARVAQAYYPPPPEKPNTLKVVVLTVIGTLALLGAGAGLFWLLQKEQPANGNINTNLGSFNGNLNSNVNSMPALDTNFNFNMNTNFNSSANFNSNFNINANVKTPTPTPSPSPSASPTPKPSPSPETSPSPAPTRTPNANRPANTFNVRPPTPSPTPRQGPRPTPNQ